MRTASFLRGLFLFALLLLSMALKAQDIRLDGNGKVIPLVPFMPVHSAEIPLQAADSSLMEVPSMRELQSIPSGAISTNDYEVTMPALRAGGFLFHGTRQQTILPASLVMQTGKLYVSRSNGPLNWEAHLSMASYLTRSVSHQYGLGSAMTYNFSDFGSLTLFGNYYTSNPYFTASSFELIPTSSYGAYVTLNRQGKVGLRLGVKRYYDSFRRQWDTSPIITPRIKLSSETYMELPLGDMVKPLLQQIFSVRRDQGPNMIPYRIHNGL